MTDFVCIGVPYWLGQKGPPINSVAWFQMTPVAAELNAPWIEVAPDFAAASDPVTAVNRALADTIAAYSDRIPLIFAGDCLSCIGAVKGLEGHHPAVVWYDAHGDFNTHATTPSGYLGGMPLAALVGRDNQHLMQGVNLAPLDEADILITDARDLDPEEGVNLRASRITHLTDVNLLLRHPLPPKPLYIHFDTDVVNTEEMPAMSYPAKGGPALDETITTLRRVIRDGRVAGILFSLWNAALPKGDITAFNGLRLVRATVEAFNG